MNEWKKIFFIHFICLFVCLSHNMWIRGRMKIFFLLHIFFQLSFSFVSDTSFFPILSFNGFHKRRNQFQNFIFFLDFPGFFFLFFIRCSYFFFSFWNEKKNATILVILSSPQYDDDDDDKSGIKPKYFHSSIVHVASIYILNLYIIQFKWQITHTHTNKQIPNDFKCHILYRLYVYVCDFCVFENENEQKKKSNTNEIH